MLVQIVNDVLKPAVIRRIDDDSSEIMATIFQDDDGIYYMLDKNYSYRASFIEPLNTLIEKLNNNKLANVSIEIKYSCVFYQEFIDDMVSDLEYEIVDSYTPVSLS